MRPYYRRAGVTLYQGDALELLPALTPGCADLLLTDPPYGVRWESGRRAEAFGPIAGDQDQTVGLAGVAAALRVLRAHRHLYVFGPFDLGHLPIGGLTDLVWDKGQFNGGNCDQPWGPQHEPILFGVHTPSAANRRDGYGQGAARLRRGSVLRYPRLNSRAVKRHPTEKPVALLRELIESSSRRGELVLDPFAGSGATLEAALLEGRRAVGIELEEGYCGAIAERLEAALPRTLAEDLDEDLVA